MAMIAYKCPDVQVTVVDINQVRKGRRRGKGVGARAAKERERRRGWLHPNLMHTPSY
jgi:hypothetical protein